MSVPISQTCEVLIAGLGPAGLGVLTWLESVGALEHLLKSEVEDYSIVVVDPLQKSSMGAGGLGYLTKSNTTSSMFVRNLTQPQTVDAPKSLKSAPHNDAPTELGAPTQGESSQDPMSDRKGCTLEESSSRNGAACTSSKISDRNYFEPCELIPSPLLHSLTATPEAHMLSGNLFVRLARVAPWFQCVWKELETKRFSAKGSRGKVFSEKYVRKVVLRKDGRHDVHIGSKSNDGEGVVADKIITTKKLILATGGKPRAPPEWLADFGRKKTKLVISSEEALRPDGFTRIFSHLRKFCTGRVAQRRHAGESRVVVIGGAHSALSVIQTLISGSENIINSDGSLPPRNLRRKPTDPRKRKTDEFTREEKSKGGKCEKTKPKLAMYAFMKDEIVMLHKRPVEMFWFNSSEAKKAGITFDAKRVARDGKINTYTGLRGPSKKLWRSIVSGLESRVRTFMYEDAEKLRKKVDMCNPDVLIYATGYGFNLPIFENSDGEKVEIDMDYRGALNTTENCQIVMVETKEKKLDSVKSPKRNKKPLETIVATGLGAGLRTTHSSIGGEYRLSNVRADGTNLYSCQQARVICREVWGAKFLHDLACKAQRFRRRHCSSDKCMDTTNKNHDTGEEEYPVAPTTTTTSRCVSPTFLEANTKQAAGDDNSSDSDTTAIDSETSITLSSGTDGEDEEFVRRILGASQRKETKTIYSTKKHYQ